MVTRTIGWRVGQFLSTLEYLDILNIDTDEWDHMCIGIGDKADQWGYDSGD